MQNEGAPRKTALLHFPLNPGVFWKITQSSKKIKNKKNNLTSNQQGFFFKALKIVDTMALTSVVECEGEVQKPEQ